MAVLAATNNLTTNLAPRRRTVAMAFIGETIYKGSSVARRSDGKYYMYTPGETNEFAGVAADTATTTTAAGLVLTIGPDYRLKVYPVATAALSTDTFRATYGGHGCIAGDDDATFDAEDNGMPVYAVDGGTFTIHPKVPNSSLVGYLSLEATGAIGTGWGYVRMIGEEQTKLAGAKWHPTGALLDGSSPQTLHTIDNAHARTNRVVFGKKVMRQIGVAGDIAISFDPDLLHTESGTAVETIEAATGSALIATAGGANTTDSAMTGGHTTTDVSWVGQHTFSTTKRVRWGWVGHLPDVTVTSFKAGLALTLVMDRTTDADGVTFEYNTTLDTTAFWRVVTHIAGVDATTATTVAVTADTVYRFEIDIDDDRIARCYIDGVLVHTTAALTSLTTLIPMWGGVIQMESGTARSYATSVVHISEDARGS